MGRFDQFERFAGKLRSTAWALASIRRERGGSGDEIFAVRTLPEKHHRILRRLRDLAETVQLMNGGILS